MYGEQGYNFIDFVNYSLDLGSGVKVKSSTFNRINLV